MPSYHLRKVRSCIFSIAETEDDKHIGNWPTPLATPGLSRIIRRIREAASPWFKRLRRSIVIDHGHRAVLENKAESCMDRS